MWDYEGLRVEATYLDVPVVGRVVNSRVKYGGGVQHTVVLENSITFPWNGSAREAGERILVDMRDIVRVMSN